MKLDRTAISFLAVIGVVIIVVVFIAIGVQDRQSTNTIEGQSDIAAINPAQGSPYTDLDKVPVNLSDFDADVLVVNAWASWCPFCVNELPDFDQLGEEFQDRNVVVVAINRKETQATAKAFVDHVGNPEHIEFLLDNNDFFYKSIGGFSMPETLFYDKGGNIVTHKRGFMAIEEMRDLTEAALAANQ